MAVASHPVDPWAASLPDFSVDWRFLLPMDRGARLLAAGEAGQVFAPYFSGLEVLVVSFCPGLQAAGRNSRGTRRNMNLVVFDPANPPFAPQTFDILAVPFGLPQAFLRTWTAKGPSAFDLLLKPGGILLAGVVNRWSPWRGRRQPGTISQAALKRMLDRSGFTLERVYGALPNLVKPAYILPLKQQALGFMLRQRYSGRRAGRFARLFSVPLLSALLARLLPGYFLLAQRGGGSA